jgi:hypothetical protein
MPLSRGFKGGLLTGLIAGAGLAALFGPALRPGVARWVRPAAKAAIRGGIVVYEAARARIEEGRETLSDLTAEVQAEFAAERRAGYGPAPTTTEPVEPSTARAA